MDRENLLEIIKQAEDEKWDTLNLSFKRITEIPSEIGRLVNLKTLRLDRNQIIFLPQEIGNMSMLEELRLDQNRIIALPSEIGKLKNLSTLRLENNELTTLPADIGNLKNLIELNLASNILELLPNEIINLSKLKKIILHNNQLLSLPNGINNLNNIETLDLRDNQLTFLPSQIGGLVYLKFLNLFNNELKEIPAEIKYLKNLQEIHLEDNNITQLPNQFGELRNLSVLHLSQNKLSSIPSQIGNLSNLSELKLDNNIIEKLPSSIGNLTKLVVLDLSFNKIKSLPEDISNLINLETIDLSNNNLISLPYGIKKLDNLSKIILYGNNIKLPPEITNSCNDPKKIIFYYFSTLEKEKLPLNEAKIVLIGQGDSGKTSILNRLLYDRFNESESQTSGLNIERWKLKINKKEITVNIWDFGGQQIYHATHQCFLTKRTLYLLVLDSRLDPKSNRVDYWLKVIESFAEDSPIIIIGNQCDSQPIDINIDKYMERYPNIKAFIEKVSCKDGTGIDELRDKIKEIVNSLKHILDPVPVSWKKVKEKLEKMESENIDFITQADYRKMCSDEQITEEKEQRLLAGFMNDLGVAINYLDSSKHELKDLNILNPEWVTNGIYKIITANWKYKEKALLCLNDISEILDTKRYPTEKNYFLINLMEHFELCFKFEENGETKFLIPSQLRRKEPLLEGWEDSLTFQIHYEVLPESVISRLIVRNHLDIPNEMYWREGCVIQNDRNLALVKSDTDDNIMFIKVKGDKKTRKDLLQCIRDDLKRIHKTFSNLKPKEKVSIPGYPKAKPIDYKVLRDIYNDGNQFYRVETEDGSILVNVEELLFGVVTKKEVQEYQLEGTNNQPAFGKTIQPKVFANNDRKPQEYVPSKQKIAKKENTNFFIVAYILILITTIAVYFIIPSKAGEIIGLSTTLFIIVGVYHFLSTGKIGENTFKELIDRFLGNKDKVN